MPRYGAVVLAAWRRVARASKASLPLVVVIACTRPVPEEVAGSRQPETGREEPRGVVLTSAATGSALARAGLQVGEVVVAWRPIRHEVPGAGDESGVPVVSPFDLLEVEYDRLPRSEVSLQVLREGETRWLAIPPGRWYQEARPALTAAGRWVWDAAAEGEPSRPSRDALDSLAGELAESGRPSAAAWLQLRRARLTEGAERVAAETAALAAARLSGDPISVGWTWRKIGTQRKARGAYDAAREALESAFEVWPSSDDRIAVGHLYYQLGHVAGLSGQPAAEEAAYAKGLEIRRRLAPESLSEARAWMRIAKARATQDDLDGAFAAIRRAHTIAAARVPGGFDEQNAVMILGIFHSLREEWDVAEGYMRRALEMVEALDPQHRDVGPTLENLGTLAAARGDLVASDAYYRRALAGYETSGTAQPTSMVLLETSGALLKLAANAATRRDLVAAEQYHERSLAIRERLAPDSLDVATAVVSLADVLLEQGRYEAAESRYRRALALHELHVPGTRAVAQTLSGLGTAIFRRGDLEGAAQLQRRALALVEGRAGTSIAGAKISYRLAKVLVESGNSGEARRLLERADAALAKVAPGTVDHALALHALGRLQRESGEARAALATLERAVAALDAQLRNLGGSPEARSMFRAAHVALYRDHVDLLLELGEEEAAFGALERSKARNLLVLLRERGVKLTTSASPERVRRLEELAASYDEVQAQLTETTAPGDPEELVRRLARLRREQAMLWAELRRESSTLAKVDPVGTVDRAALGDRLGAETVALSYSVGERRSRLFVVGPLGAFRSVDLAIGEAELQAKVDRLRLLVERLPPAASRTGHVPLAAELFELLVRPAATEIEAASGVLVSPDGPLHELPFAALVDARPVGAGADGWRYLVAWRPLFHAASLTVYDELARLPAEAGAVSRAVAFGSPVGEGRLWPTRQLRALGRRFSPLPFSRLEVEGLADLYGSSGQAWLGREATEARAKRLTGPLGVVHYATHAFVDHTSPLDSGLVLTASVDGDRRWHNGVLQAWEIFEGVPVTADLVTLSACATSDGPMAAGEGLLSLTRAFQASGARSVLASLWKVPDRPSAELMLSFYGYLHAGRDKAEALRAAQLDLIAAGSGHPHLWAAFQLYGDPVVGGRER